MNRNRPLSEQDVSELRARITASREKGREMFPLTLEIEGQLATLVRLDVLEALLDAYGSLAPNRAELASFLDEPDEDPGQCSMVSRRYAEGQHRCELVAGHDGSHAAKVHGRWARLEE